MGIIAYLIYGSVVTVSVSYLTVQAHDRFGVAWWPAYLLAINAVAFFVYAYDKILVDLLIFLHLRVPDNILKWGLALPGGILGAILAMWKLHHKTGPGETMFRIGLVIAFAVQVVVIIVFRWAGVSPGSVDRVIETLTRAILHVVQILAVSLRVA